jgi:hypothetical protein
VSPIAVSLLLAIAPIILLYQQNRLIAIQGKIADSQTKLIQLQTLAARSDQSRQLYSDYQSVINIVSRLESALSLYEKAGHLTVRVDGRATQKNAATEAPQFDQTLKARDYDLDLCGPTFPASLRPTNWLETECDDTNPYEVISLIKTFDFERNTYSRTVISLIYYLQAISVLHRDTLNTPESLEEGHDKNETFLPDLLKTAATQCRLDPSTITDTINLATNVRIVEAAAQQIGWLFKFGFASGYDKNDDANDLKYLDKQCGLSLWFRSV